MALDRRRLLVGLASAVAAGAAAAQPRGGAAPAVCDLGSRRELFVDRYLVERLDGARLEIGRPQPAGIAVRYDRPWEGPFAFYTTVLRDGDRYRMYYRGHSSRPGFRYTVCYAESRDAVHWTKPDLGLFEVNGTRANNVVLFENQVLAAFLDARPGVPAAERYKGNVFVETRFGAERAGLLGYSILGK